MWRQRAIGLVILAALGGSAIAVADWPQRRKCKYGAQCRATDAGIDAGIAADGGDAETDAGIAADGGDAETDAGIAADGGDAETDAGIAADGGDAETDAGIAADGGDAEPTDSGEPPDTGVPPDSGITYTSQTAFYFARNTAAPASLSFSGSWGGSTNGIKRKLIVVKPASGDEVDTTMTTQSVGADSTHGFGQFVSVAIAAQTISGSVTCWVGGRYTTLSGTDSAMTIYVVDSGGSLRGTLLSVAHHTGAAFSTTYGSRAFADTTALSSVDASAGDRLVIELGGHDTNSAANNYRLGIGVDSDNTDFSSSGDTSTTKNPVCTFSSGIQVQDE